VGGWARRSYEEQGFTPSRVVLSAKHRDTPTHTCIPRLRSSMLPTDLPKHAAVMTLTRPSFSLGPANTMQYKYMNLNDVDTPSPSSPEWDALCARE
jgi:hypothetical protein